VKYRRIGCFCGAEFMVPQWLLDAMRQKGDKAISCPRGHGLLLSTIHQPEPPAKTPETTETIEEVMRKVEEKLKGSE